MFSSGFYNCFSRSNATMMIIMMMTMIMMVVMMLAVMVTLSIHLLWCAFKLLWIIFVFDVGTWDQGSSGAFLPLRDFKGGELVLLGPCGCLKGPRVGSNDS